MGKGKLSFKLIPTILKIFTFNGMVIMLLTLIAVAIGYIGYLYYKGRTISVDPDGININIETKSDKNLDLRRGEAIGTGFDDGPERANPYTKFPLAVSTQAESPFSLIGYLFKSATDTQEETRLPLYGRPMYGGTDKWNYYTKDDSRNVVVIPIETQADREIMDGDPVNVQTYDGEFNAHLYDVQVPRYIPFIV